MPRAFNSAYVERGMMADAFLPRGFGEPRHRFEGVRSAAQRQVAPELLAVVREQNQFLPRSELREKHLEQLARGGCAVVATGQQVGLFLGPLYTIYKAASAVVIARALSAETGIPCIPLFWLQTEDHDFAEIKRCTVPIELHPFLQLELKDEPALARCSLADRALGPEIKSLLETLSRALEDLPHAEELLALLQDNYREGASPGRAFAGVLAALFAEDGLLVFDPRCSVASQLAAPLIKRALLESARVDSLLAERGEALRAAGFSEQIEPRPGSPLPFFHLENSKGPRYRLLCRGDHFQVQTSRESLDTDELLSLLEREPLRFSTSALLRPLLQDSLFPTAVYVGGAAEVSYLAQLQPLYELFAVQQPLVAERAHFLLVPHRLRRMLDKLGLKGSDLNLPREALLKKLPAEAVAGAEEKLAAPEWASGLEQHLDQLIAASPADPHLVRSAQRLRASVRSSLERLGKRQARAAVARNSLLSQRLEQLDFWLRPEGEAQERRLSFPAFAARIGLGELRSTILAAVNPFDPSLRELDL